jgi:hypothetical protein
MNDDNGHHESSNTDTPQMMQYKDIEPILQVMIVREEEN